MASTENVEYDDTFYVDRLLKEVTSVIDDPSKRSPAETPSFSTFEGQLAAAERDLRVDARQFGGLFRDASAAAEADDRFQELKFGLRNAVAKNEEMSKDIANLRALFEALRKHVESLSGAGMSMLPSPVPTGGHPFAVTPGLPFFVVSPFPTPTMVPTTGPLSHMDLPIPSHGYPPSSKTISAMSPDPRHIALRSVGAHVVFSPYKPVHIPQAADSTWSRLFVGQTPSDMDARQLAGLLQELSGRQVRHVEKITRWTRGQMSTGCFHVFVQLEDAGALLALHEQKALCDTGGAWVAKDETGLLKLKEYVDSLRQNPSTRPAGVPSGLLTVQMAHSTYYRRYGN